MKIALKNRIAYRLKELGIWVHKGSIESRAKEWGYLGDCATRRCRELENEGILERKEEQGSVWYRYKKSEKLLTKYIIVDGVARQVVEKVWI